MTFLASCQKETKIDQVQKTLSGLGMEWEEKSDEAIRGFLVGLSGSEGWSLSESGDSVVITCMKPLDEDCHAMYEVMKKHHFFLTYPASPNLIVANPEDIDAIPEKYMVLGEPALASNVEEMFELIKNG